MAYSPSDHVVQDARVPNPGGVGRYHRLHFVATNDLLTAVETDGYFDAGSGKFTEGVGDILTVIADVDGTPAAKQYLVTRTAGDIALTAFA